MSYVKYTKTSTFLFPLLEISKDLFKCEVKNDFGKLIMTTRFLNSYIIDKDLDISFNENPYIYIVIKGYRDKNFESFVDTLFSLNNYIDDYDRGEFLIGIFKVAEEFINDYCLIIEGKYSKISKEAKSLIISNNYYSGKSNSTISLILSKSTSLKDSWEKRLSNPGSEVDLGDQEVWGIIEKEKESFDSKLLQTLSKKTKLILNKDLKK